MSRRTTSLAVASLAAASLITLGSASASAKDHADWALEFVDNAVSNSPTDQGEKCFMNWSNGDPAWSAKTKAACFFTLSLQKAMGYTEADIVALWGTKSPDSKFYFQWLSMSPVLGAPPPPPDDETYFRRVTKAADIQKGDVFFINEKIVLDANGEVDEEKSTPAHTVIITGPATEITPQVMPRYSGTKQYAVPVVDSTSTAHGCFEEGHKYADSRWSGDCKDGRMSPGAGTATMRVYTDSLTGILLGFTWSVTASQTSYYSPSTRPYRIGRLFKLPAPMPTEPPPPPP
ncbi:hypothetical protein [Sorangium sp. So ce1335]|uniref:hypothetical protein n=1 Tax=Sorangium sp. So ce1335 TaxID=3133335 RepID=UPI003F61342A